MRRALSRLYERRGTIALILSVAATILAIAALGLAGYAVHQILTYRQDVYLIYSQEPNFAAMAAVATASAVTLSVLAIGLRRRSLRRREALYSF